MVLRTPGDLAKAGTEHAEQVALFQWAAINSNHEPRLKLLFAIPNGGERNKIVAAKMVAEGARSGVPDVMLPVPGIKHSDPDRGIPWYNGLFIEMKKGDRRLKRAPAHKWDTGGVDDNQIKWLTALEKQGYKCVVCYSWLEAANTIKVYLTGSDLNGRKVD